MSGRIYDVHWNGQVRRVERRDDGTWLVDGVPTTVEVTDPHAWRVTVGGHTTRLFVARDALGPWVSHQGAVVRPEVVDAETRTRESRHVPGGLAAPMPATVRAVHVKPGQHVAKGETLVVLEAMKMELPLRAPADGTITSVSCAPGDLVQPGVPLVEIA